MDDLKRLSLRNPIIALIVSVGIGILGGWALCALWWGNPDEPKGPIQPTMVLPPGTNSYDAVGQALGPEDDLRPQTNLDCTALSGLAV